MNNYIYKDGKYYKESLQEIDSKDIITALELMNVGSNIENTKNSLAKKYIIVKCKNKDLKEGMYNNNGHTFMKWDAMMEWYKTNPYLGYHIPTIEEMKKLFKGKTVKELKSEINFEFSGYRITDGVFNPAGNEEYFWSCSPTSDKDDAHYCFLTRGSDSPNFYYSSREYGFGCLLVLDK